MDAYEKMMLMLTPAEDQFNALIQAAIKVLCDDLIDKGDLSVQAQLMFSRELAAAADKMIEAYEYSAAELGVELSDEFLDKVKRNLISEVLEITDSLIEKVLALLS